MNCLLCAHRKRRLPAEARILGACILGIDMVSSRRAGWGYVAFDARPLQHSQNQVIRLSHFFSRGNIVNVLSCSTKCLS